MVKPKVSILIPVYNREKYVAVCIQSALNQTFSNFEIVISDNASADATWQICKEFAERDSRVRIFQNNENIGPVLNWKRCIDEAKGEYAKLLFSDDLIYPQFLQETLTFLEDPEVGFVFTKVCIGEDMGKGKMDYVFSGRSGLFPSEQFIEEALFGRRVPVSPGCAVFRTTDLKNNLVTEIPSPTIKDFLQHGAGPDLLIYLLTAVVYPKIGYVSEPLTFFRRHEGSITISDKQHYLGRCYDQAKVWFARNYVDSEIFKHLCINIYLQSAKKKPLGTNSQSILDDYCKDEITPTFVELIEGYLRRRYRKLRNSFL